MFLKSMFYVAYLEPALVWEGSFRILIHFLGGKFAEEKLSKEQLPRKEKLRFLVPVTAKPSMKLTLYIVPLQYMADS